MICSACTADVPDEDAFCENCGARLHETAPDAAGCSCGAAPEETDEEGFCLRCGRRVRRPPSDHLEEALSADLAAVSDRGQRHEKNEDRFALVQENGAVGLVVCDGVSSTSHAEVASETVTVAVARELQAALQVRTEIEDAIRRAIAAAGAELTERAGAGLSENAPSTTVVAAVVNGSEITVGWMGDSRAYWIDASGALPLTQDHSWLNAAVAAGEMSEAEALEAPQAHAITRWVGADAGEDLRAEIVRHQVRGSGTLLLCTDGLWNYAADPQALAELFARCSGAGEEAARDALRVAQAMVAFANEQGGRDNITVALLRMHAAEGQRAGVSAIEPEGEAMRTTEDKESHGGAV